MSSSKQRNSLLHKCFNTHTHTHTSSPYIEAEPITLSSTTTPALHSLQGRQQQRTTTQKSGRAHLELVDKESRIYLKCIWSRASSKSTQIFTFFSLSLCYYHKVGGLSVRETLLSVYIEIEIGSHTGTLKHSTVPSLSRFRVDEQQLFPFLYTTDS